MATKPPIPSTDAVKQLALQVVVAGVTRVVATLVDPAGTAKRVVEDVRDLPTKAAGLPLKVALEVVTAGEKVRALLPGSKASVVAEKVADKAREVGHAVDPDAEIDSADGWDAAAPTKRAVTPKPDPAAYVPPVMHEKAVENPVEVAAAKAAPRPAKVAPVKTAPVRTAKAVVPAKAVAPATAVTPEKAVAPAKSVVSKAAAPARKAATKLAAAPAPVPSLTEAVKETVIAALDQPLAGSTGADDDDATADRATDAPVATVTPIHAGRDGHRDVALPEEVEAAIEEAPDGATMTSKELPIAGYDNLNLSQLRSRLSKLDVVALAQLRDHERTHADRAPMVTMLENRIAKLAKAAAPNSAE